MPYYRIPFPISLQPPILKVMRKTVFLNFFALILVLSAISFYSTSAASAAPPRIELFVTTWCPYCKVAETTLRMKGLAYTRYDIEHDSEAMKKYQEIGAGGVPIFRINGRLIRGMNLEALNAILRESNPSSGLDTGKNS